MFEAYAEAYSVGGSFGILTAGSLESVACELCDCACVVT